HAPAEQPHEMRQRQEQPEEHRQPAALLLVLEGETDRSLGHSAHWPWTLQGAPARGAAGGSRTHTPLRTRPFEGLASTVPPPPQTPLQCMAGSRVLCAIAPAARARGSGGVRRRLAVRRAVFLLAGRAALLDLDVPPLAKASHRK